jgi:hypothetical protein
MTSEHIQYSLKTTLTSNSTIGKSNFKIKLSHLILLFKSNTVIFLRRNLLESTDLSTCQYNRDTDPFCPIFPIQMILDEAEPDRKLQDTLLEIVNLL